MSNNQFIEHNHYLDNDDHVIAFSSDYLLKVSKIKYTLKSFIKHSLLKEIQEHFKKRGIK